MAAIILTWNPEVWAEWDYEGNLELVRQGRTVSSHWSVGRHRNIPKHADAYFYLQGKKRGLIAHGVVETEAPYRQPHFNDATRTLNYVDLTLDTMLPLSDRLPRALLEGVAPQVHWARIQQSGQQVPEVAELALADLWREYTQPIAPGPDDVPPGFPEGAARTVYVNRYERDPRARRLCIDHWGTTCIVCSLDFGQMYGEIGEGYIHIHHLTPVSQMGPGYRVDPVEEMRPLCANCHAMVHVTDPPMTPEQLERRLRDRHE